MTRAIGIVTNDRRQVFQRSLIAGVERLAAEYGCAVQVDSIAEDPQHPQPVSLPLRDLAGLLVIANVLSDDQLQRIHATGIPMALVSHQVRGLPIPAVIPNNTEGIQQLVDYVVRDCGRQELVFIRGDMHQHDGIQRDAVFQQSVWRHDLTVRESRILRGDFIASVAAESLERLLQTDRSFDAVIASDYLMAAAALDVLRQHRIRVPEEVCVVAFGDGPEAEAAGLTTVAADVIELGRRATRQLFAIMDGVAIQGVTWLNTAIIERETCLAVGSLR